MRRSVIRGFRSDQHGSALIETALGVSLILTVALPFAALVGYATHASRDLATAQAAVRDAARNRSITVSAVTFTCGPTVDAVTQPCTSPLVVGTYVAGTLDTPVDLPFGITLHTNARAVARVG